MLDTTDPVLRASDERFQRGMNGLLQTHFRLKATRARSFDGEIFRSHVSPMLRLADIAFSPHFTCLKAGRHKRRTHNYLISHQIEGSARVRQGGRIADVAPDQIFFIDTAKPFEIETDTIRTRSIYLDAAFWRDAFPERDYYTATALDCGRGFGPACRELVAEVFRMPWCSDTRRMERIGAPLVHLLAMALTREVPHNAAGSTFDRLAQIRDVVQRHLGDPALDVGMVGARVGLSVRQVHAVFSATGTTLMRHVTAERLDRIARELQTPALAGRPVSAIAFDWGFNEAAHFSRQFKARFGVSPTEYRARHLARPSDWAPALH